MLYAVGTRIDLTHMNNPQPTAAAIAVPAEKKTLYEAGTKILFIKALKEKTIFKITDHTIAYVMPVGT